MNLCFIFALFFAPFLGGYGVFALLFAPGCPRNTGDTTCLRFCGGQEGFVSFVVFFVSFVCGEGQRVWCDISAPNAGGDKLVFWGVFGSSVPKKKRRKNEGEEKKKTTTKKEKNNQEEKKKKRRRRRKKKRRRTTQGQ